MEGYLQYCGEITAVHVEGQFQYCGGYSVHCNWGTTSVHAGYNISSVGDKVSTVEGIQYTGRRILISTCLVINNDKKISTFLYYDTKFSFGGFSKIQADFMPFESWTSVLQVQSCFEIIDKVTKTLM